MVNSGLLFLAHLCMQDIHSKHLREFLHQRLTILQFTFPSSQDMGLQGTGEADTPTGLIQALPGGLPKSKLLSSRSAVSDSLCLWPHGLQHVRLPSPSPSPGARQSGISRELGFNFWGLISKPLWVQDFPCIKWERDACSNLLPWLVR